MQNSTEMRRQGIGHREDGEIEEGEIQERIHTAQSALSCEIGLTSHRRDSASPASTKRGKMSRRHRCARDRRDVAHERDHFTRSYESGTYRPERCYDDVHECELLFEEIRALTKRVGIQDATKSLDVLCRELKSAIRKLDRARRIMNKMRSDSLEMAECAHRVFSGLRSVHVVCCEQYGKVASFDLARDVMDMAMNYRHALFGSSQKRELESWIYDSDQGCSKEVFSDERREGGSARTAGERSVAITREEAGSTVSESQIDRLRSKDRMPWSPARQHSYVSTQTAMRSSERRDGSFRYGSPTSCLSAQQKDRERDMPLTDEKSGWVDVKHDVHSARRPRSLEDVRMLDGNVSAKRQFLDKPLRLDSGTQLLETSKMRSREAMVGERDMPKKPRCGTEAKLSLEQSFGGDSKIQTTDRHTLSSEMIAVQKDKDPTHERNTRAGHTEISNPKNTASTDHPEDFKSQKESSLVDVPGPPSMHPDLFNAEAAVFRCQEPHRLSIESSGRESQFSRRSVGDPEESRRAYLRHQTPADAKSVRYTATEANGIKDHASQGFPLPSDFMDPSIPPPPPPLIFKPKPISPDITFEIQPDSYWDQLLSIARFPKPMNEHVELCDLIFQGKMCLVLDLDSVLFSTTRFSELVVESDNLLQSCLDIESRLPYFSRSLHRMKSLAMWVKLRPGLNKFLRIARSAFRIYGHTSRAKEEVDLILKLIDPDRCFFGDRIIYQEMPPGECIFKKVHALGPEFRHLQPVTFILADGCLTWEEMESVFGIESYLFFAETKAKFGLRSPSMFKTKSDEEDWGFLLNALQILLQLRQQAFALMADPHGLQNPAGIRDAYSRIPKHVSEFKPWDVRRLMAEARITLMPDVHIYFDCVFPPNEPHDQQVLWRMASSMGAVCSVSSSDRTTHLVTLPGSNRILWARSHKIHVVSPVWIEASYVLWFRLNEACYSVKDA